MKIWFRKMKPNFVMLIASGIVIWSQKSTKLEVATWKICIGGGVIHDGDIEENNICITKKML